MNLINEMFSRFVYQPRLPRAGQRLASLHGRMASANKYNSYFSSMILHHNQRMKKATDCSAPRALPRCSKHSDSAHFACLGMQNGSFLVFGRSPNVRASGRASTSVCAAAWLTAFFIYCQNRTAAPALLPGLIPL